MTPPDPPPQEPTAAYRRVTVPRFLFAVAQLGVTAVGLALCLAPTVPLYLMGCGGGWCSGTEHSFRGYPIPWMEHTRSMTVSTRSNDREEGPPEQVGVNPAVPALAAVLVAGGPTVGVRLLRRVWRRDRGPASRAGRLLAVLVVAASAGLTVAFLDVLTCWGRTNRVPFEYPPASRLRYDPEYQEPLHELRRQRDGVVRAEFSLFGTDDGVIGRDPDNPWPARTRRTVYAFVAGAVFGCPVFRPWRRPAPPAS